MLNHSTLYFHMLVVNFGLYLSQCNIHAFFFSCFFTLRENHIVYLMPEFFIYLSKTVCDSFKVILMCAEFRLKFPILPKID